MLPEDIGNGEREVVPDQVIRSVAREYPDEHTPALPAVFGVDGGPCDGWGRGSWRQKIQHGLSDYRG